MKVMEVALLGREEMSACFYPSEFKEQFEDFRKLYLFWGKQTKKQTYFDYKNISFVKNSFRKNFPHIPLLQEILEKKKEKKSVQFRNMIFYRKDLNINLPMILLTLQLRHKQDCSEIYFILVNQTSICTYSNSGRRMSTSQNIQSMQRFTSIIYIVLFRIETYCWVMP